jgi:antitoxin component YwqK of YwqJK toxin-antitoxin module
MSTGIFRTYYDIEQTKLYQEYFILNGNKEGEYKAYNTDGQLWIYCTYINGILEGEHKEYYINGQLKSISKFINGAMECQT